MCSVIGVCCTDWGWALPAARLCLYCLMDERGEDGFRLSLQLEMGFNKQISLDTHILHSLIGSIFLSATV